MGFGGRKEGKRGTRCRVSSGGEHSGGGGGTRDGQLWSGGKGFKTKVQEPWGKM